MKKYIIIGYIICVSIFLLACKSEKTYRIEFRNESDFTIEIIHTGKTVETTFPILTKDKYVFIGWVDHENRHITENTRITKNYTLFPLFEDATVTFNLLSNETIIINVNEQDPRFHPYPYPGDQLGFFLGYFDEDNLQFNQDYQINQHISLYPMFRSFEDSIQGQNFSDSFFGLDNFLADYLYVTNQLIDPQTQEIMHHPLPMPIYQPFEDYLLEIGGYDYMTEDNFIAFFAEDLIKNNPIRYRQLDNLEIFLLDDFVYESKIEMKTYTPNHVNLWYDPSSNTYYMERHINHVIDYVEIDVLTEIWNEDHVLTSKSSLVPFKKNQNIFRMTTGTQKGFFLEVLVNHQKDYLHMELKTLLGNPNPIMLNIQVEGIVYLIDGMLYDYIEPLKTHLGNYIQLQPTIFTTLFIENIFNVYALNFTTRDFNDVFKFLNRVLMVMYPEKYMSLSYPGEITYHYAFENMFSNHPSNFNQLLSWTGFRPLYTIFFEQD